MCRIDLKDAYFSIPVHQDDRSPSGIHQNTKPNHGVLQNSGHQRSRLPRKSLHYASGQAGCVRSTGNSTGHTGRIGIPGKLPIVPTSSFPDNSVSGLHSGLSSKTAESPTREGILDQVTGQIPLGERQSECKETRTDTQENVSSNLGCTTSPSSLQGAPGIKTQGIENERAQYRDINIPEGTEKPHLVGKQPRILEWKATEGRQPIDNHRTRGLTHGLGCLPSVRGRQQEAAVTSRNRHFTTMLWRCWQCCRL